MRHVFIVLLIVCTTLPFYVQAQELSTSLGTNGFETRLRVIEDDIDSVNAIQDAKIADLERTVDELRRRVERFNEDYEQLRVALSVANTLQTQLTALTADTATAGDNATRAYEAANSIRWIVSIAAILITGMTAALGLLFSQRFIDLKAGASVAEAVMTRVENRINETASSDQALAEINQRLEAIWDAQQDKPV